MSKPLTALVLAAVLTTPLAAQGEAWRNKWYWGAQGGLIRYQTPLSTSWREAATVGGHWLITAARSALYVAYDQILFDFPNTADTTAIADASSPQGFRLLEFTRGRRIQAHLYIVPTDGWIQPFLGGGFTIQQVTDATPTPLQDFLLLNPNEQQGVFRTIDQTDTKAFPVFTGGLQLRFGGLALFGHYQFLPEGRDFLLSGSQHALQTGLRYALSSSREEVTTRR